MLDIVGHIQIDETNPDRVRYLIACIRSYAFLKNDCKFILNLDNPSQKLFNLIKKELTDGGFDFELSKTFYSNHYGQTYCKLLEECENEYVLNFIEDAFMMEDMDFTMACYLSDMDFNKIDILKTCFFRVEQNSSKTLNEINTNISDLADGKMFTNHSSNFIEYQKFYGTRYYIGVNFLTTLQFAKRFWGRDIKTKRPHEYEIVAYDENWIHNVMIPNTEMLAAIDDPHGEVGTDLLSRSEPKFNKIWEEVKLISL